MIEFILIIVMCGLLMFNVFKINSLLKKKKKKRDEYHNMEKLKAILGILLSILVLIFVLLNNAIGL